MKWYVSGNEAKLVARTLSSLTEKRFKKEVGKGRCCAGVSYRCKINHHSECTSMTCSCECGHAPSRSRK